MSRRGRPSDEPSSNHSSEDTEDGARVIRKPLPHAELCLLGYFPSPKQSVTKIHEEVKQRVQETSETPLLPPVEIPEHPEEPATTEVEVSRMNKQPPVFISSAKSAAVSQNTQVGSNSVLSGTRGYGITIVPLNQGLSSSANSSLTSAHRSQILDMGPNVKTSLDDDGNMHFKTDLTMMDMLYVEQSEVQIPCLSVKMVCQNGHIFVHKILLAVWSEFLRKLLVEDTSDCPVIILPDVDVVVLANLLIFMYTGRSLLPQLVDLPLYQAIIEVLGFPESRCPLRATSQEIDEHNRYRLVYSHSEVTEEQEIPNKKEKSRKRKKREESISSVGSSVPEEGDTLALIPGSSAPGTSGGVPTTAGTAPQLALVLGQPTSMPPATATSTTELTNGASSMNYVQNTQQPVEPRPTSSIFASCTPTTIRVTKMRQPLPAEVRSTKVPTTSDPGSHNATVQATGTQDIPMEIDKMDDLSTKLTLYERRAFKPARKSKPSAAASSVQEVDTEEGRSGAMLPPLEPVSRPVANGITNAEDEPSGSKISQKRKGSISGSEDRESYTEPSSKKDKKSSRPDKDMDRASKSKKKHKRFGEDDEENFGMNQGETDETRKEANVGVTGENISNTNNVNLNNSVQNNCEDSSTGLGSQALMDQGNESECSTPSAGGRSGNRSHSVHSNGHSYFSVRATISSQMKHVVKTASKRDESESDGGNEYTYTCWKCELNFRNKRALRIHMSKTCAKYLKEKYEFDPEMKCLLCLKIFTRDTYCSVFMKHIEECHELYRHSCGERRGKKMGTLKDVIVMEQASTASEERLETPRDSSRDLPSGSTGLVDPRAPTGEENKEEESSLNHPEEVDLENPSPEWLEAQLQLLVKPVERVKVDRRKVPIEIEEESNQETEPPNGEVSNSPPSQTMPPAANNQPTVHESGNSEGSSVPVFKKRPGPKSRTMPDPVSGKIPGPKSKTMPNPVSGKISGPKSKTMPDPVSGKVPGPQQGVDASMLGPSPAPPVAEIPQSFPPQPVLVLGPVSSSSLEPPLAPPPSLASHSAWRLRPVLAPPRAKGPMASRQSAPVLTSGSSPVMTSGSSPVLKLEPPPVPAPLIRKVPVATKPLPFLQPSDMTTPGTKKPSGKPAAARGRKPGRGKPQKSSIKRGGRAAKPPPLTPSASVATPLANDPDEVPPPVGLPAPPETETAGEREGQKNSENPTDTSARRSLALVSIGTLTGSPPQINPIDTPSTSEDARKVRFNQETQITEIPNKDDVGLDYELLVPSVGPLFEEPTKGILKSKRIQFSAAERALQAKIGPQRFVDPTTGIPQPNPPPTCPSSQNQSPGPAPDELVIKEEQTEVDASVSNAKSEFIVGANGGIASEDYTISNTPPAKKSNLGSKCPNPVKAKLPQLNGNEKGSNPSNLLANTNGEEIPSAATSSAASSSQSQNALLPLTQNTPKIVAVTGAPPVATRATTFRNQAATKQSTSAPPQQVEKTKTPGGNKNKNDSAKINPNIYNPIPLFPSSNNFGNKDQDLRDIEDIISEDIIIQVDLTDEPVNANSTVPKVTQGNNVESVPECINLESDDEEEMLPPPNPGHRGIHIPLQKIASQMTAQPPALPLDSHSDGPMSSGLQDPGMTRAIKVEKLSENNGEQPVHVCTKCKNSFKNKDLYDFHFCDDDDDDDE